MSNSPNSGERVREHEEETQKTSTDREVLECPECGGKLITDEERGETVCSECGLVVEEDEIDHGPEWRAFEPEP